MSFKELIRFAHGQENENHKISHLFSGRRVLGTPNRAGAATSMPGGSVEPNRSKGKSP